MDESRVTERPHYMKDGAVGSQGTYGQGTAETLRGNQQYSQFNRMFVTPSAGNSTVHGAGHNAPIAHRGTQ